MSDLDTFPDYINHTTTHAHNTQEHAIHRSALHGSPKQEIPTHWRIQGSRCEGYGLQMGIIFIYFLRVIIKSRNKCDFRAAGFPPFQPKVAKFQVLQDFPRKFLIYFIILADSFGVLCKRGLKFWGIFLALL